MSTRKTKLATAIEQRDSLRVQLESEVLRRKLNRISAKGEYDAVAGSRQRRQPVVERTGEDEILNARKRLLSHNIGRDLERNFASARGILHQFRVNVVGCDGKIQVNVDNGGPAAQWFNQTWAKDCDFRDEIHWSVQCQNVVAACIREGDILVVFDDDLIDDTGKLLIWESDQIVSLVDAEFTKWPLYREGHTQENGIVRDKHGRVLGYFVSGKRGMTVIDKLDDVTFYPREVARLVKNPWRANQGRGIGSLLTAATNFQDLYEILVKELQSAKVAASLAGWTKRTNAETDWDSPGSKPEYLPENMGKEPATVDAEAANGSDSTATNYERFEGLTGGMWEYLDQGDEVGFADINRPNVHLAEFIEAILGHAGASVGLARAYTVLRADSSYTAFRGDMILSWATFRMLQKWLERSLADWVGVKAIGWAIRKKLIAEPAVGWERSLSWSWPTMPGVDALKEENAVAQALKNGTTDFSKLLGPDWRARLQSYGEQISEVRRLLLPLGVLESKSGGSMDTEPKQEGATE